LLYVFEPPLYVKEFYKLHKEEVLAKINLLKLDEEHTPIYTYTLKKNKTVELLLMQIDWKS